MKCVEEPSLETVLPQMSNLWRAQQSFITLTPTCFKVLAFWAISIGSSNTEDSVAIVSQSASQTQNQVYLQEGKHMAAAATLQCKNEFSNCVQETLGFLGTFPG